MAKKLKIRKIDAAVSDAAEVTAALDNAGIGFEKIETVNWDEFPYRPEVKFRIAHTGDAILINYRCSEEAVRAVAAGDNGALWEDSCVEFFASFDGKHYYNIECNCLGTILCAVGADRNERTLADKTVLEGVKRYSSLTGKMPADGKGPVDWEVSLIVPATTYFGAGISDFTGRKATANFYKCGDKLPTPHFLSWNPIATASPDFHRPEFFAPIEFE